MHYSPPASLPESRNLIELILSFLITIALQEDQGEFASYIPALIFAPYTESGIVRDLEK